MNFTENYIRIESGFMGQIVEWPEVITEGETIDECRDMLKDALEEMILAHKQLGYSIPIKKSLFGANEFGLGICRLKEEI